MQDEPGSALHNNHAENDDENRYVFQSYEGGTHCSGYGGWGMVKFTRFVIDGRSFSGNSISIVGGKVIVDGVLQDGTLSGVVEVRIVEGTLHHLTCDANVTCGEVTGNVDAGMAVKCGNVGGDVDAGMDVTCGDVKGNVDSNMNVNCGNVGGSVDANMGVTMRR